MNTRFCFMFFALLVGLALCTSQRVSAQTLHDTTNYVVGDTLYVAWAHNNWLPRTNALRDAILGDTAANGTRANLNRVYKLKINGLYWDTDDITNPGFPLRLVGDQYAMGDAANYPAILQMQGVRADKTAGALHLITGASDVLLKNVFVSGRTIESGSQAAYQPVVFNGNNCKVVVDNCIFEQSNFSLIVLGGTNCDARIVNNKFRNLEENPPTQQWAGRGISIWTDEDSVIIENNTFFNIGFATFQMEGGSAKYLRYNHNTIVNCGRGIMSASGDWWQSAYFANNLIINGFWEGEGFADMHTSGRDPRATYGGLFTVNILPAMYGPEQMRRVVIANTFAYLDPLILAKYGTTPTTDTITRPWFLDPVSKADYVDPFALGGPNNGHIKVIDTVWLTSLPAGMTNYLTDNTWLQPLYAGTNTHMVDSMWAFITQLRSGVTGGTTFFYHPTVGASDETWPLPENFSYTDPTLKTSGTDGLPIGDLNWFPAQKATFLANQATYVGQIESIAGPRIAYPVDSTSEAEVGTLGGTAAVAAVQGLTYYDYNGSGSITWHFNVTTPGQYDMKFYVNETGRGQSGPVIGINGTQIHDKSHMWGQFIFDVNTGVSGGKPNNAWIWVPVTADSVGGFGTWSPGDSAAFTLSAGANTIAILNGGWGEMLFAEIDLVKHGALDTIKLKAPDAIPVLVTPGAVGITWVASAFKFVSMGSAGTISWNLNAPTAGTYHLRTFYQNTGTAQSMQIKDGVTTLSTESFGAKAAGTGLDNFSAGFALSAGLHTIVLSGGNVNVDFIQLIKETPLTGVLSNDQPSSFALEQNYPNPFNPTTTIRFSLEKASNVKLKVYNLLGQNVATLMDTHMNAGAHAVVFDAGKFSSGVYFYRLEAGAFHSVKKMLLMK